MPSHQQTLHIFDQQLAELEHHYPARALPAQAQVVRAAPAPTGLPHIGTALQAIINYALARKSQGIFIRRIEDPDRKRLVPGAMEAISEALQWLQVPPDEGSGLPGAYGPYSASEQLDLYRVVAQWLVAHGDAYLCFCSPEQLEQIRVEQMAAGLPPRYDRRCRSLTAAERQRRLVAGEPAVIRLAMPLAGAISFIDPVRGPITFPADAQDDPVLLKTESSRGYLRRKLVWRAHQRSGIQLWRGLQAPPGTPALQGRDCLAPIFGGSAYDGPASAAAGNCPPPLL
jgi:glutamyl/glutaminyl-tRNA synthetase